MPRPNILFLLGFYPGYGGVENVTTVLANAFSRKGMGVHILSFKSTAPELLSQLDDSVVVHKLSQPVAKWSNVRALKGIIGEGEIDFIINQWCLPYSVTWLCRAAMRGAACRLLAVHHNSPDRNAYIGNAEIRLEPAKSAVGRAIARGILSVVRLATRTSLSLVYRHSDLYIVLSPAFIPVFAGFVRISDRSKLKVLTNPVTIDTNAYHYSAGQKNKTLLFVGRIDHNQKRASRLIDVWEQLFRDFPDWNLELVGDGPEKERLERMVAEKGIQRVTFHGFDSPVSHYRDAAILLLVSEYEGFPLVLAEAMSFGVIPCVYGSYRAVYDIVEHGKNGMILETPFRVEAFADEVGRVMASSEKREEMAKSSIETVERYGLEKVVAEWEKLFSSMS
jgi:glycosyltransferase involved in cell wall biosynthesis